jgi:hypothetical protein
MLLGSEAVAVNSFVEAITYLREIASTPLDFIILDDQLETHIEQVADALHRGPQELLKQTKIIHLYTPTTGSLPGSSSFNSHIPGVTKLTKPPRQVRLLQTMSSLRSAEGIIPTRPASEVAAAMQTLAAAQRTLFGNVLVAEGMGL